MSTLQSMELLRQSAGALELVTQAQAQLLVVRARQLAEERREASEFRNDALTAEANTEQLAELIDALCKVNHLGPHGSPLEQLMRIGQLLDTYAAQHNEEQSLIGELRKSCAERDDHITKQACVIAELGVIGSQPREPVPAGELPFNAQDAARIFLASCRGLVVGKDGLDLEALTGWFANLIMRGHDEHARKYGKLIELCITGERGGRGQDAGRVYVTPAEKAIAAEADRFVDPSSPPTGWKAP